MNHKKKTAFLLLLNFFLALAYTLILFRDCSAGGNTAFAWLEPRFLDFADRVEIYGSAGRVVLVRENNGWFFSAGNADLPVRQSRVEDLFAALSRKEAYRLRAASFEAAEKLGLPEENASRVIVRGGAGLPLLDLLVGASDSTGREVYLKRADEKEIYSGEDHFTLFTESAPAFWYDLRLFPRAPSGPSARSGGINAGDIQQADVSLPEDPAGGGYTLRRKSGGWELLANSGGEAADTGKTESWLRSVLEAEAEDFGSAPPGEVRGGITLWLGDGTKRVVEAGAPQDGRRSVTVSHTAQSYILRRDTLERLFRERAYFSRSGGQ